MPVVLTVHERGAFDSRQSEHTPAGLRVKQTRADTPAKASARYSSMRAFDPNYLIRRVAVALPDPALRQPRAAQAPGQWLGVQSEVRDRRFVRAVGAGYPYRYVVR